MMQMGLYGVEEFRDVLRQLQREAVDEKDIKKATREGLKIIQKDARSIIKRNKNIKSRTLYKSVKVTVMGKRHARFHRFKAGTKVGPAKKMAPHAHLVEFGTASRTRKNKSGKTVSTGSMPSSPFMRPAFRKNTAAVYRKFASVYSPLVQKRINKAFRSNRAKAGGLS
jgi:HK97 gp10 family phage protein